MNIKRIRDNFGKLETNMHLWGVDKENCHTRFSVVFTSSFEN